MVYYRYGKVINISEMDGEYFVILKRIFRTPETYNIPKICYDKIERALKVEELMPTIKILSAFMNKGMRKDLIFYLNHDEELYFKGMVVVAISWIVLSIIFGILGFVAIKAGYFFDGCILLGITSLLGVGFCAVKMYLHIRKDNIEMKEILTNKN